MASQTRSIKIPGDLAEAAQIRGTRLQYPSWGAYVKGLMRYDGLVQGPHQITVAISKLPLVEQDAIDRELLEYTKSGSGKRGQFLQHFLEKHDLVLKSEAQSTPPKKAAKKKGSTLPAGPLIMGGAGNVRDRSKVLESLFAEDGTFDHDQWPAPMPPKKAPKKKGGKKK